MSETVIICLATIVASVAIVAIVFGRGFSSRIDSRGVKIEVEKSSK